MVEDTGDIPEREEVAPDSKHHIIDDVLGSGEILVELENGAEYELHGHDTYSFGGVVYTKDEDDDVWFYKDAVVSVRRHYD